MFCTAEQLFTAALRTRGTNVRHTNIRGRGDGDLLAILETLVDAEEPLGVTALSEHVDVAKSVVHNHLSTLRAHGCVVKRNGQYEPSLRMLALGRQTRDRIPVVVGARAKVDNLADATGETTTLFVIEGGPGRPGVRRRAVQRVVAAVL